MVSIREADVDGKHVLVRADLDVPIERTADGPRITSDARLKAALPTIEYLLSHNARIILCGHLGRPGGEVIPDLSMKSVAQRLYQLLRRTVYVTEGVSDPGSRQLVATLQPREIAVVENLRFWPQEEENNPQFAQELAALGELYVNEAFGSAARAHASIVGVPQYLPSYAGFELEREVSTLSQLAAAPNHPFVLIAGGAKVSDKLPVVQHLGSKVDVVLTGGVFATTLLKARGADVKSSLVDVDALVPAQELNRMGGGWLIVPPDFLWKDDRIMDIGPAAIAQYQEHLRRAQTVFWNGSLGRTEEPPYDTATREIARTLTELKATTIVSGGDTVGALDQMGLLDKFSFVSTGGGATLQFLGGQELPGIAALERNAGGKGLTKPTEMPYIERPLEAV